MAKRKFKRENVLKDWNIQYWNDGIIAWKPYLDGIEVAPFRGPKSKDWAKLVVDKCIELVKKNGANKIYAQAVGFERYMKKNKFTKLENIYVRDLCHQ